MGETPVFLKNNVQVEPLVRQWYAHPYLLSPASAAMNLVHLHLRLMKSFVSAPELHARAAKNPNLLGGRFLDCDKSRVGEIKALLQRTEQDEQPLIALAAAIGKLEKLLAGEAKGYALEPLYEKIPEALKGYVELVYDLNNRPAIRWIEPLLYHGPAYREASQSLMFSTVDSDDRPFSISTPRLPDDQHVAVTLPFRHEALDDLFRMKTEARPFGEIADRLGLDERQREAMRTFFTEEAPASRPPFVADGVRIRYFGHATVLVETRDVSILVDPVVSYDYPNGIDRFTYLDLPERLDYVVITHNHLDHCQLETLLQLRHKIGTLVFPKSDGSRLEDPSLATMFRHLGFDMVREMGELEVLPVPEGEIVGVPFLGEHGDLNIRTRLAYLIKLQGRSVLFAADSRNPENEMYGHLQRIHGPLDLLFIGMECDGAPMSWDYGPLLNQAMPRPMDLSRPVNGSDCEKALGIMEQMKAREVCVYAMGQEPWLVYIMSVRYDDDAKPIVESNRLLETCASRGIPAQRLFGRWERVLSRVETTEHQPVG